MGAAGKRRLNAFLQIVFAFVIFLSVNLLGNTMMAPARLDLTEDGLFTLNTGTKEILDSLEEPLTIKLYFSEKAATNDPELFRYGHRVRDFLAEFEALSGGKIRLQVIDPEPFSEEREEASSYGVQSIGEGEDAIFLGLVGFDDTNRLEVIAHFSEDRERFLEFDLAKVVFLLAQEKKPVIGLLSSLPMRFGTGGATAFLQGRGQPYILYSQLIQMFDVVYLEDNFNVIPVNVDVLLVVHPPELSEDQLYEIDQFALSGRPAMIFVDPFAEVSPLMQQGTAGVVYGDAISPSSDMAPLFKAWGVKYSPDQAVVDFNLGQRVEVGNPPNMTYRDYIHWLGVGADQLDENNPITAFLLTINFASAGVLEYVGGENIAFQPLIETSDGADLVPINLVQLDVDPGVLIQTATPQKTYTLAARLTGQAGSAFPDKALEQQGLVEGNINVIIGADADIFEDRFWVRVQSDGFGRDVLVPFADNAAFIVNALDYLSGSDALISLRARGGSKRPLETFHDLRREATVREEAEKETLRARLREVEARLVELQRSTPGDEAYSSAREVEIQNFRTQAEGIQRNLSQVQRTLIQTIQTMENRIIFLNMFIVPVLLILIGLLRFGLAKRRKRT